MAEKPCILIPKDEYNSLKDSEWELDKLKTKYESLEKRYDALLKEHEELKSKYPELNIRVEARVYGGESWWGEPYIGNVTYQISNDSTIIPANSIRNKLYTVFRHIEERLKNNIKLYIGDAYTKQIEKRKSDFEKLNSKYYELYNIVEEHDKKCWFDSNKIIKNKVEK